MGVVGAVCEGDFGAGATVAEVGGFVDGKGLVVFGVGVVVDAEASLILPIVINTADKVGDVLMGGGVGFVVVVANVGGVVDCCGCGCCC